MPRFVEVRDADTSEESRAERVRGARTGQSLLTQESVTMTVLAQDPAVPVGAGPVTVRIDVPSARLQRGPRNHRFHVVDVNAAASQGEPPVSLHAEGDPWLYVDRWAGGGRPDRAGDLLPMTSSREFHAQNVFAIAAHTLALFERYLGRRIPWRSQWPHLYLVPSGFLGANASYSPAKDAVVFGWLPRVGDLPEVRTCLSYDVIAHEVTHAILDGLRPRYVEPGLPDQLAFHEALADLVALLSVFTLPGVVLRLLRPDDSGRVQMTPDGRPVAGAAAETPAARLARRGAYLTGTPLFGLAEQLGQARSNRAGSGDDLGAQALRRSVGIRATTTWLEDAAYDEPHRRAEILVAAFMQSLAGMWAARLEVFDESQGLDAARVAEEGEVAAAHLLGMILRSLDYLPPVELEFGDVLDAVLTADHRLNPDDPVHYREALRAAFTGFGISQPAHQILDVDGMAAPTRTPTRSLSRTQARRVPVGRQPFPDDPDAGSPAAGLRYQHLNYAAMQTSPEEVFTFMWNNAALLGIDMRLATRVDRVLGTTRVGPDGLIVNEVLADYTQWIGTTSDDLPPGLRRPRGMAAKVKVEMWGGGVLVFDQFGRFRLHQRKPILDLDRQRRRLRYLVSHGLRDTRGGYGASDGVNPDQRFALLHPERSRDSW